MERFKRWWLAERKGRFEEGTSQDMFPTNGDVVIWCVLWGGLWMLIAIVVILRRTP